MSKYANVPVEIRERGRWLPYPIKGYGKCSNCGLAFYGAMPGNENIFRFCPGCGACMEKEEQKNE